MSVCCEITPSSMPLECECENNDPEIIHEKPDC